jgi:uncharacterized membrane protein YraQ (UPF0718 family)
MIESNTEIPSTPRRFAGYGIILGVGVGSAISGYIASDILDEICLPETPLTRIVFAAGIGTFAVLGTITSARKINKL